MLSGRSLLHKAKEGGGCGSVLKNWFSQNELAAEAGNGAAAGPIIWRVSRVGREINDDLESTIA